MNFNKDKHKKNILQVLPALNSGGVERGTLEVAKKIVSLGHGSFVISVGGKMVESLESDGSKHIKINVATKNPFLIFYNVKKIIDVIKFYNIDVIHARSRAPAWSCYFAAKLTKIKFITTFHGTYNFNNKLKKFYNSIMTKGDKIIAVSNFIKNHIIENYQISDKNIEVIHRGVDTEVFSSDKVSKKQLEDIKKKYGIKDNIPVLLIPSRVTRWKGHLVLIEALNKIKNLDFICLIVGDCSKHQQFISEVKSKIDQYGLQNKIKMFENEPNILPLYKLSSIILSTSIEPEAFGRTIIEAQSMQKIVIATNIGGAAETITNDVSGFHVKQNDNVELADKIKKVLTIINTDEEKKITEEARKAVCKRFSLDNMLNKTMQIYEIK